MLSRNLKNIFRLRSTDERDNREIFSTDTGCAPRLTGIVVPKFFKKNGYIPLGSLPGRYRQSVEDFTNYKKPFLQVNGDLYVQYQNQLKQLASGRPVVGISWSGGFWSGPKKSEGP